jgi:hypothetical protein
MVMEATNQRWDEAELYRIRGALLRASGEEDAAMQAFRRACDVAVRQGARLWELRARCSLLELAACQTDTVTETMADAADQLQLLVASFEDARDLPDLRRASAVLEHSTGGAHRMANM